MYYEALDLIVSVVDKRFKQESFSSYAQMETILVKAASSDDNESDVDTGTLPGQLSVLLAMLKISCFDNPVDNILVTSILVTNILVTSILVTNILVTSILVTNILAMKVPEPERRRG